MILICALAILLAIVELVAVFCLWPWGTLLAIPVYRKVLRQDLAASLEAGSLVGWRVAHLGAREFLLRPVLWTEDGPSAAPFLCAVAKARPLESGVEVLCYAPLGALLFTAAVPLAAVGIPDSAGGLIALLVVVLGLLWFSAAMYRSEFRLCLRRIDAWAPAP
jgi:hypothetical protein